MAVRWQNVIAGVGALAVLVACTSPTTGTSTDDSGPGPGKAVARLSSDWQAGRTHDASELTTTPAAAAQLMTTVTSDLGATHLAISTGSIHRDSAESANVTATMTWTLPVAGTWSYDVPWHWTRRGTGTAAHWLLDFSPATIHPKLGPQQTLAVKKEPTTDGPIVDRNDAQLISPVTVHSVVLLLSKIGDADALAARLATLLGPIDDTVSAASIEAGIAHARDSGHDSYTVINLRDHDFNRIESQLHEIASATFPSSTRPLPPTPDFARAVLGSVIPVAKKMTTGAPGWRIVTVDAMGDELDTLAEKEPVPGEKVTLTLDPAVQQAAQQTIDPIKQPTVLVAFQASTGEILAVAQNDPANAQGPISLVGQYPPGSTFKIVTATAGIDAGLITPTTTVPCPGAWHTHGKTIHNEGFSLGDVTATKAFAHSCNTSFAWVSSQLKPDALPDAAKQYGIGLDFDVKGITTLTGKIQRGDTFLKRAENGFGQGTDLLTPFSGALMAATVDNGQMPIPVLIRGTTTTVDQPAPARSKAVQKDLRTMMRAVVEHGTAQNLQDAGTVYAKTGTASYLTSDGELKAHAWTVGFRGDLAFSIMIVNGDSSKRTDTLADTFLKALPDRWS